MQDFIPTMMKLAESKAARRLGRIYFHQYLQTPLWGISVDTIFIFQNKDQLILFSNPAYHLYFPEYLLGIKVLALFWKIIGEDPDVLGLKETG